MAEPPTPGSSPDYDASRQGSSGYSASKKAPAGGSAAAPPPPKTTIEQVCGAPGEIAAFLPPPHNRVVYMSVLGGFAERLIQQDYCDQHNCQPFSRPGSLRYDYFDDSRNPKDLIAYYKFFNSHVTDGKAAEMLSYAQRHKMFKFADVIRHVGDIQQHFEIKPASSAGIRDGREKLDLLDAFIDYFKLPYRRGTFYTPTPEMLIATIQIDGIPLELLISINRREPGLLVYKFCVRGELEKAMKRLRTLLGKLALIIVLIGIILPIEDPIEVPEEKPGIEPIPWPIPASANFITPAPYRGHVDAEFSFAFHYVRGLSRKHQKGETYPVTIRFESEGTEYFSVIDFVLQEAKDASSFLVSANKGMLNIAPAGNIPLVLNPKTEMVVHWHE